MSILTDEHIILLLRKNGPYFKKKFKKVLKIP